MKIKKLVAVLSTLAIGSALSVSVAGCDENETPHVHDYSFTVIKSATCEEDGEVQATCKDGDSTYTIAVDKLGHDYGKWIVEQPTAVKTGKATKICAHDKGREHDIVVELPALTDPEAGYTVTSEEDGVVTYKLANENGEIEFSSAVATTVDAAVSVAKKNNTKVIFGSADVYSNNRYSEVESDATVDYELGTDYCHVIDGTQNDEGWYSLDDEGEIFAVLAKENMDYTVELGKDGDATIEMLEGYGFNFTWCLFGEENTNGVGNFISALYSLGKTNVNGDFKEELKDEEGTAVYSFSFSTIKEFGGDTVYFNLIKVSFTLDSNSVVEDAKLECSTYTQYDANDSSVANFELLTEDEGVTYYAQLVDGREEYWTNYESFTISQRSALEEDETLPVNPYSYDDVTLLSYTLSDLDGNEIDLNETINLKPGDDSYSFKVGTVAPDAYNSAVDPVKIYLRTDDGDEPIEAFYEGGTDGKIIGYFNRSTTEVEGGYKITLKFNVAGDFEIVFKTENTEKVLNVHVPYIAPSGFESSVYQKDEVNGTDLWSADPEFTVYQNQSLTFKSKVANPYYENPAYTAKVISAPAGADASSYAITESMLEGESVSVFKASVAGTYTIQLSSAAPTCTLTDTITVVVNEAPEVSAKLNGAYENKDEQVKVTFVPAEEGATNGEATIVNANGDNTVVTYTYDSNTRAISTTYKSGADNEYGFELTEAFNLFLTAKDPMTLETEKIHLVVEGYVANSLVGTHVMGSNSGAPTTLTANVAGTYLINLPGGMMTFYNVNDGTNKFNSTDGGYTFINYILVDLKVDDVLKVWSSPLSGQAFTVSELEGAAITLNATEESFALGNNNNRYTLTATVNSALSNKDVTWTTSDSSIATVSNGTVAFANSGEVTITATLIYGGVSAECTFNVSKIEAESVTVKNGDEVATELNLVLTNSPTATLTATVAPDNTSIKTVTWTSSDTSVATVSSNGVVTAVGVGTATITATCGNVHSTVTVNVTKVAVTTVALDKTNVELFVNGATETLTATVAPDNASLKTVTWTSSDEEVVKVVNGVLTPVKAGTATVTATADGVSATCEVTVTYIAVESVTLSEGTAQLYVNGETVSLTATIAPSNACDKTLIWTSSSEDVVTVKNGVLTPVNAGTATVTVTAADGKTATCQVTVTYSAVESINLSANTAQLYVNGESLTLTTNVLPATAADKNIVWTSSDTNVVKVVNGVLTPVKAGTATVTATAASGVSETCQVTVTFVHVESVELDESEITLYVSGESQKLNVTFNPSFVSNSNVSWTSSDEKVATVVNGVVTGLSVGTVTITVTSEDGEKTAICTVNVEWISATEVILDKDTLALTVGGATGSLKATVNPEGASDKTVTWTSSDETVATVVDGVVTGLKAGTATITATSNDDDTKFASCEVTVTFINVESISMDETASVTTGSTITLTPTFNPSDASDKTVTWTSSDETVATVENGVVTGLKAGTVTITATTNDGAKTATCTVTVKQLITITPSQASSSNPYVLSGETGLKLTSMYNWYYFKLELGTGYYNVKAANYQYSRIGKYDPYTNERPSSYTDEDGYFFFMTEGEETYMAIFAGRSNLLVDVSYVAAEDPNAPLEITEAGTIYLTDADYNSAKQYTFTVNEGETWTFTTSDAYLELNYNTGYEITVSTPGNYTLNVYADGYNDPDVSFTVAISGGSSEAVEDGSAEHPYVIKDEGTVTAEHVGYNTFKVYKFTVGEGETWSITHGSDAYIEVGTELFEGEVSVDYSLNLSALTAGTYYIAVYAYDFSATDESVSFSVAISGRETDPEGPQAPIEITESGNETASGISNTECVTYVVTVEEGKSVILATADAQMVVGTALTDGVVTDGQIVNVDSGSLTLDKAGTYYIQVYAYYWSETNASFTVELIA